MGDSFLSWRISGFTRLADDHSGVGLFWLTSFMISSSDLSALCTHESNSVAFASNLVCFVSDFIWFKIVGELLENNSESSLTSFCILLLFRMFSLETGSTNK
uniref:Ovule protein n=1 Tax=Schistosoma curassoni TaxID=6186 RepID=A0A183JCP2_9TREM